MQTWIALLRGINVGGNNKLPMKELVDIFERAGFRSVRTYIQSGNVVFSSKARGHSLGTKIATDIQKRCGFQPKVLVLSDKELADAICGNPFPKATSDPKSLHLCFLSEVASDPDLDALTALKAAKEAFVLKQKVFYLHTPHGFGDSKLAAKAERLLGVDLTCRNWRTVNQLMEMADATALKAI